MGGCHWIGGWRRLARLGPTLARNMSGRILKSFPGMTVLPHTSQTSIAGFSFGLPIWVQVFSLLVNPGNNFRVLIALWRL